MKLNSTLATLIPWLLITACDGKKDPPPPGDGGSKSSGTNQKNDSNGGSGNGGPGSGAPGSLALNQAVADDIGSTSRELRIVEENLAPPNVGALAVGAPLADIQTKANEVQTRIKGSMEGVMRALNWVRGTLDTVEPQIREKAGESSGVIDMGFQTIEYSYESATKYRLFILGGEGGDFHITVEDNHFWLKRRAAKTESQFPDTNFIEVVYQDELNWAVRDNNTTDDCRNRPQVLTTYAERTQGIWRSKFAIWGGRTEGGVCQTQPADNAIDFTYYEYIGDERHTSAAAYEWVPLSITNKSEIKNYNMVDDTTVSINPVCIEENQTTKGKTACASDNTDIATPNFGLDDEWSLPADISKIRNIFPESI